MSRKYLYLTSFELTSKHISKEKQNRFELFSQKRALLNFEKIKLNLFQRFIKSISLLRNKLRNKIFSAFANYFQ